jgi:hypothetical protein
MTRRMHEHEIPSDEALVRRLLAAQFPEWALPNRRGASGLQVVVTDPHVGQR